MSATKIVAHIFPERKAAMEYLRSVLESPEVLEIDRQKMQHINRDGVIHKTFTVRDRDDIGLFLAYEFADTQVHGHYKHMPHEDYVHMLQMLFMRTRHVPEGL